MRRYLHERILIYKVRRGDADSFAPIYDFYVEKVYRFVYLKMPSAQDAEDIVSEAFLKVWQYIKDNKKIKNLQAFIYQVARNLIVDYYRKNGTTIESIDEQEVVIANRSDLTLEEKMMLKTEISRVEGALRELKDAYREVIVLHFLNELSLKEIAQITGKTPGAARVILHRGLKALKGALQENKTK